MTMKEWKISEAKARLSEMLSESEHEPQLLLNRKKPVAAVVNINTFYEFQSLKKER